MSAKFIVIEGPDKSGKATQAFMLANELRNKGRKVIQLEVPYNDYLTYTIIYYMLHNGWAKKYPNLFQAFQFINKFVFQLTTLVLYRFIYDYVIFDRWSLSMIVYGDASGANPTLSRFFYRLLFKPDITLIMRGKSYDRDEADDSYEKDDVLQKNVRIGYKNWFLEHHDSVMINNSASVNEVHGYVMNVINDRFFNT